MGQSGMGLQRRPVFSTGLLLEPSHHLLKGHRLAREPLDGQLLETPGCKNDPLILEGIEKCHEIPFLPLGEADTEPGIVKLHDVLKIDSRSVMEIRRPGSKVAQDRPFRFADVRALTTDQGLPGSVTWKVVPASGPASQRIVKTGKPEVSRPAAVGATTPIFRGSFTL